MTAFTLIVAPGDSSTDKLTARLARNGSKVTVADNPSDAQVAVRTPTDVLVVLAGVCPGQHHTWHVGSSATPVLTEADLPETIAAKLVIINVPAGERVARAFAARATGTVLVCPHSDPSADFAEDSDYLLREFVTGTYDRYKPDASDLRTAWDEVFRSRVAQSTSYLRRTREPVPYRALQLVGV